MDNPGYNSDASLRIRDFVNEKSPNYRNFNQKDSGELMQNLLTYLGMDLNRNTEKFSLYEKAVFIPDDK